MKPCSRTASATSRVIAWPLFFHLPADQLRPARNSGVSTVRWTGSSRCVDRRQQTLLAKAKVETSVARDSAYFSVPGCAPIFFATVLLSSSPF
jgi:hypothetical protein